jgi:hypothetical protein
MGVPRRNRGRDGAKEERGVTMGFRFRKRVRLFKGPALSGIGHPSLLILEFGEGWCLAQPNFFAKFRIGTP